MGLSTKITAWNSIEITVPRAWEMGRMGSRHLVFEKQTKVVMEIKWQPVKGKFSAKSHLKRLAGLHGGRLKDAIQAWHPPQSWLSALDGYQVNGFQWQAHNVSGRGVILYCAHCRNASLIQFLGSYDEDPASEPLKILTSFSDHRDDGQTLWSLFDIRVLLPEVFKMHNYSFKPGRYEISFANGSAMLSLYRWAPAAALLDDQNLADFGTVVFGSDKKLFRTQLFSGYPAVEWESRPKHVWLFHRLRAKARFHQGRLWHIESKNRILGARLTDKKPLEDHLLGKLCASYEPI